jgi:pimeloyl-ACP methyl ester carboxylesterase
MTPAPSLLRHFHVGIEGLSIHVAEGGAEDKEGLLFLHGWPQDWSAFAGVMSALQDDARVVAIDLPGIGLSDRPAPSNDKRTLAYYVHGVIESLGLHDVTLVGHDVGGQIAYAYLHAFPGALKRAVLMNTAIPGVDPWSRVTRNPQIWHFGFHAVPGLPEILVSEHRSSYFNFFYDRLAGPAGVSPRARASYALAYARPVGLRTGFEWYRAFPKDERDNLASRGHSVGTPVLYLRGEFEGGDIGDYVAGLRDSGLTDVRGEIVAASGHFAPDEQAESVAGLLRQFIGASVPQASLLQASPA